MQAYASLGAFVAHTSIPYTVSLDQLMAGDDDGSVAQQFVEESASPYDTLACQEQSQNLQKFLQTLSPKERELVRLYFWDDRSQSEIAEMTGVSKMAVSKALARIYAKGRESLSQPEYQVDLH